MYIEASPFGRLSSDELPAEGCCTECGRELAHELDLSGATYYPCSPATHDMDRRRIMRSFARILHNHVNGWAYEPHGTWVIERRIRGNSWVHVFSAPEHQEDLARGLLIERQETYPNEHYRMLHAVTIYTVVEG